MSKTVLLLFLVPSFSHQARVFPGLTSTVTPSTAHRAPTFLPPGATARGNAPHHPPATTERKECGVRVRGVSVARGHPGEEEGAVRRRWSGRGALRRRWRWSSRGALRLRRGDHRRRARSDGCAL